jgi:hypothetical protein
MFRRRAKKHRESAPPSLHEVRDMGGFFPMWPTMGPIFQNVHFDWSEVPGDCFEDAMVMGKLGKEKAGDSND